MNGFSQLLRNADVSLPLAEVCLLILVLLTCLVFKMTRFGLITAYLFVYRWGLLFFLKQGHAFLMPYLVFGFVIGTATVIGLVWKPSSD
ncbi:MAG: hypothetical protein QME60_07240 [Verrucomicrobiota bacterium]|nr:hypothetical protein [Verrucomicrobiota bacterium]